MFFMILGNLIGIKIYNGILICIEIVIVLLIVVFYIIKKRRFLCFSLFRCGFCLGFVY